MSVVTIFGELASERIIPFPSRVMAIFLGLRCSSGTAMSFYVRVEQTVFVHSVHKKAYLSPLIQTCTGVFSYAEQDQSRH